MLTRLLKTSIPKRSGTKGPGIIRINPVSKSVSTPRQESDTADEIKDIGMYQLHVILFHKSVNAIFVIEEDDDSSHPMNNEHVNESKSLIL